MSDCLIDWLIHWLINCSLGWLIDCALYGLRDRLVGEFVDWVIPLPSQQQPPSTQTLDHTTFGPIGIKGPCVLKMVRRSLGMRIVFCLSCGYCVYIWQYTQQNDNRYPKVHRHEFERILRFVVDFVSTSNFPFLTIVFLAIWLIAMRKGQRDQRFHFT